MPKVIAATPGSDGDEEEYAVSNIRLNKDLRAAAMSLKGVQARYLVDRYYQLQGDRTRADSQCRENETPNLLLTFSRDHAWKLECAIKLAMKIYASSRPEGVWLLGVHGIGPVLAAGLLAHLDVTKAKTAGSFWRFAGLDPTVDWEGKVAVRKFVEEQVELADDMDVALEACARIKGRSAESLRLRATQKADGTERSLTIETLSKALSRQPWNAKLKVLTWKCGDSFMKQSKNEKCFYGKLYRKRKELEIIRNEAGELAEQAKLALEKKDYRKDTKAKKAYKAGMLPPGHLELRARRPVVKLFLSHLFQTMFEVKYGRPAPIPYVFAFKDHDFHHFLRPPGWEWDVGEAREDVG